jgi:hypothetical protein
MKYFITIGDSIVFENLTKDEAEHKTILMLALSSRLDIFYNKHSHLKAMLKNGYKMAVVK